MKAYISQLLRDLVIQRAMSRCEYCLLHQNDESAYPHEIDHIIVEKHFGETTPNNLAYACFYYNRFKGSDIASVDPLTGQITPLFDPRTELWHKHFLVDGPVIVPLRPTKNNNCTC